MFIYYKYNKHTHTHTKKYIMRIYKELAHSIMEGEKSKLHGVYVPVQVQRQKPL